MYYNLDISSSRYEISLGKWKNFLGTSDTGRCRNDKLHRDMILHYIGFYVYERLHVV